jgi:hypothetical protein
MIWFTGATFDGQEVDPLLAKIDRLPTQVGM